MAYRLYLPKEWAQDSERRRKVGVPEEMKFATKTEIALQQLQTLLAEGAPKYCVLADAGYEVDQAFRQRLTDMGMPYVVGITSSVVVWPPGIEPLPPKPYRGMGRPPVMPRRTKARQPVSVKDLSHAMPASAFQTIKWRHGTNEALSGRFAAVRVHHAPGGTQPGDHCGNAFRAAQRHAGRGQRPANMANKFLNGKVANNDDDATPTAGVKILDHALFQKVAAPLATRAGIFLYCSSTGAYGRDNALDLRLVHAWPHR